MPLTKGRSSLRHKPLVNPSVVVLRWLLHAPQLILPDFIKFLQGPPCNFSPCFVSRMSRLPLLSFVRGMGVKNVFRLARVCPSVDRMYAPQVAHQTSPKRNAKSFFASFMCLRRPQLELTESNDGTTFEKGSFSS